LEKVGFAFVEAAETIGSEGLHDADVDVGVVVTEEGFAIDRDEIRERAKIIIDELLSEFRRKIGFGIVEERGDVVLKGAFAAALIIDEIRLAIAEHDVARLKIAVQEIIARGAEQEIG
jgi:hypothetical protein